MNLLLPVVPRPPLSVLSALAHPDRCRVVHFLAEQPHTVSELCTLTRLKQPTVSKHLAVLRTARLVTTTRGDHDRRNRVYELEHVGFAQLNHWLTQIQDVWGTGPLRAELLQEDLEERREFTTRGTPRIRNRYFWRKRDAQTAQRLGVSVFEEDEDVEDEELWTDNLVPFVEDARSQMDER